MGAGASKPAAGVGAAVLLLAAVLTGCSSDGLATTGSPPQAGAVSSEGDGTASSDGDPTTAATSTPEGASAGEAQGAAGSPSTSPLPSQDQLAGVLAHDVPQIGDAVLHPVPGTVAAPGAGTLRRLRVSVEGGLPVDGEAFATFVVSTLNDPRSWAHDGYVFSRTDGAFDTEVVLASPDTSSAMCGPLQTMGTLSCRTGNKVVLTWYRWINGQEDFGGDLTAYREYLVNHEVGHSLGHGHATCPGPGQLAPVMMQQTKGVKPCLPNAWPYP